MPIPAVRDGRAGVQDAGSQLVALALARASVDGPDERWLDLCAGPGGKAALLGALATERGARLLANERQPHRAQARRQCPASDRPATSSWVTAPGRRGPRAPSTGCWSTRRAPVWAPCAPTGEPLAAHAPTDLRTSCPSRRRCSTAALDSRPARRRGRSTRPAHPSWRRRPGWSSRCWPTGPTYDSRTPRRWSRGDRRGVGPPPGRRPAVAAPARHRRDVPGPAPASSTRSHALGCGHHGHPDHAEHPQRRPVPPGRRGRRGSRAPTGCTST